MRKNVKRVRMLLRVSSNQQLEADGDLSVQRQLVREYAESQPDWKLDTKEYFEGSISAYKNAVADRDILQEALEDARKGEYDILVTYKDDRIGRRMWEIGAYVMTLKNSGVDIYTVKDGCISPESDDIMGQMVLALRYGNAQKSSSDTGMRVRDTAQKLVQKGKFMGGKAPYGYELVLSGEISKHGRALHKLKIIPAQAEVVRYIYQLSLYREYGSAKIARCLNEDSRYHLLAPHDVWKSAAITSILTNPVYAGYTAYKRREHKNGKYHRLQSNDWVRAEYPNEEIRIIEEKVWDRTQKKRELRAAKFRGTAESEKLKAAGNKEGALPLIDIIYCGYCGRKLTNGTKYSYWTIKASGERRARKIPIYRCQTAREGIPHENPGQFRADKIEQIVYERIGSYLNCFLTEEDMKNRMRTWHDGEMEALTEEIEHLKKELERTVCGMEILQSHIPEAINGDYPLRVEELAAVIQKQREKEMLQQEQIKEKEKIRQEAGGQYHEWEKKEEKYPTPEQLFREADGHTKRVLIDRLVERIDVADGQIRIRFRL
ncbi:MAG: recombinase family protein [Roseburia sp.]|nr:recombinase family protein [Roseburia sp.]MCM1242448.1 recombinase family protein [Roseburia sp.]